MQAYLAAHPSTGVVKSRKEKEIVVGNRRDEAQSDRFFAAERVKVRDRRRMEVVQMRLRDVSLSKLTVGELFTIIDIATGGLKKDYSWGGPYGASATVLEGIADRVCQP